jgi:hypothetical protein
MKTAGTNESAIALAKQRWAAIHPFDLVPSWPPADVIQEH